jgi:hypothetical protein
MDSINCSSSKGSESNLDAKLGEAPLLEIIEVDEIVNSVQVPISTTSADTTLEQAACLADDAPVIEISKHSDDYVLKREKECGVVHFINAQVKGFAGKLKARSFLISFIALTF